MGKVGAAWCEDESVRDHWHDQLYSWPPTNPSPVHCCPGACSSLMVFPLSVRDGLQSPQMSTQYPSWRRGQKGTQSSPMVGRSRGHSQTSEWGWRGNTVGYECSSCPFPHQGSDVEPMATCMAQGLLPVPARGTLELILTLGGQGSKVTHQAGASE